MFVLTFQTSCIKIESVCKRIDILNLRKNDRKKDNTKRKSKEQKEKRKDQKNVKYGGGKMVTDMTKGKPFGVLCRFTLPMLLSVMFQQFYNIVDSIVAGKFVGVQGLAAVGASYPVTMLYMAVATGLNVGCSVVIALYFGAKRYGKMKSAVSTSMITTMVVSLLLTVIGEISSNGVLKLLRTPSDIFGDSAIYLRIYVWGLFFLFLYNICNGVFTALGDSRTPLFLLILSSLGNIVLDLLFVIWFHMGVAGVAWATFLAQGVSSVLSFLLLRLRLRQIREEEVYSRFSFEMLLKIAEVSIPSILQQSFISIGNLCVQSVVNSFGSTVVAGYSAAIKLNTFAITSFTTLGNGVSNYTAQNIGAGEVKRVTEGFKAGIKLVFTVVIPVFFFFFFGGRFAVGLFLSQGGEKALEVGVEFLRIVSPFYAVVSWKLIADGVLRGASCMQAFMISTFTDLILRVVLAFILSEFFASTGIWMSWPVGWIIGTGVSLGFYLSGIWQKKKVI